MQKTLPMLTSFYVALAAALIATPAHALCVAKWYEGKWNCNLGKSPMTINIASNEFHDCSVTGRANLNNIPVNLTITSESNRHFDLKDEANSTFHLERTSLKDPKSTAKGNGTTDGITDPLYCSRGVIREAPASAPINSHNLNPGATKPINGR